MGKQKQVLSRVSGREEAPEKVWTASQVNVCTIMNGKTEEFEAVDILIPELEGQVLPYPICIPFNHPDDMKAFIEELIRHYNNVWADAERVNPDATLSEEDDDDDAR